METCSYNKGSRVNPYKPSKIYPNSSKIVHSGSTTLKSSHSMVDVIVSIASLYNYDCSQTFAIVHVPKITIL